MQNPMQEQSNEGENENKSDNDLDLTMIKSTIIEMQKNPMQEQSNEGENENKNDNDLDFSEDLLFFRCLGSIVSVIGFWIAMFCINIQFLVVDIFLTDPLPNNAIEQNAFNSRWWSLGKLHSIFFVCLACSTAEVVLRCSRQNNRKRKRKRKRRFVDRYSIEVYLLLLLSMCILQFGYPETHRKQRKPEFKPVNRGNCSAASELTGFNSLCPAFNESVMFQVSTRLKSKLAALNIVADTETVLNTIDKLSEYAVLVSTVDFGDVEGTNSLNLVKDEECVYFLPELGCEFFFDRCRIVDCTPVGESCYDTVAYEKWRGCAITNCKNDPTRNDCDIPHKAVNDLISQFTHLIRRAVRVELASAIDVAETQMILFLTEGIQEIAQRQATNSSIDHSNNCDWKEIGIQEYNRSTSCNATTTYYEATSVLNYNDQTIVLVATMTVLSVMLLLSERKPVCPSSGHVRLLSAALGISVSLLTFAGGLNVERASQNHLLTLSQMNVLQIWSAIYFLVSWACLNHALFLLFPDIEDISVSQKVQKKCVCMKAACRCAKTSAKTSAHNARTTFSTTEKNENKILKTQSFQLIKFVLSEVISSKGKFFMLRMLVREVFECVFQLLGIINTAKQTEASLVFGMGLLVGLNLVVLSSVNLGMRSYFGHIVATGAMLLTESLFDVSVYKF